MLTDTAGLRETRDAIEAIGVERAAGLAERADILLWLGERQDAPPHPRLVEVHAKYDLPERRDAPAGAIAVSATTGEGIEALLRKIGEEARSVLPAEGVVALNRRQAEHVQEAATALTGAAESADLVVIADGLRQARSAFDRLTGRAGLEDVLDALFGRFCLGK